MKNTLFLIISLYHPILTAQDIDSNLLNFDLSKKVYFIEVDTFSEKYRTESYGNLLKSLYSKNAYEKCLAFHYILKYKGVNLYKFIVENIRDTTTLMILEGCIVRKTNVSDYLLELSNEYKYPENKSKLTKFQKIKIDSILLNLKK